MFTETYKSKWDELSPLLVDEMNRFLDDFSVSDEGLGLGTCMQYDALRWGYDPNTLSAEIEKNKLWFTNRKAWLDEHTADICSPWTIYTATFNNSDAWENVYAYVWYVDANAVQEPLGSWPGVKLAKNEETGHYNVIIESIKMPENIIFNDGCIEYDAVVGINKTETYKFENNKEYIDNISMGIRDVQQGDRRGSIIYNMNGQCVKSVAKGLYILNGKVVL